ncbi:NAD-dependent deacylase [bacterium SCSIO 12741]|nr:NAD-dependent deacylase [bacterium SCSIO 12741]
MERNRSDKPRLIVFSGAGMSAESGIATFRDNGGLWEQYRVEEVATPEAFQRNPELVLEFYNQRRRRIGEVEPNAAHKAFTELEQDFEVIVVTQNIDNLHERAGSSKVVHLHGEITKARSAAFPELIYDIEYRDIQLGDLCDKGHQLRPHIVWFGEMVPMLDHAAEIMQTADILVVIGTSLNVYPAASLVNYVPAHCTRYLVDPNLSQEEYGNQFIVRTGTAVDIVPGLVKELLAQKGKW